MDFHQFVFLLVCVATMMVSAQDVQVAYMDNYATASCASSKSSLPFVIADTCVATSAIESLRFDCAAQRVDFFVGTTCSTTASSVNFACEPGSGSIIATGYNCRTHTVNDILIFQRGSNCGIDSVTGLTESLAVVVDQCTEIPSLTELTGVYYKVTLSGRTVTIRTWTSSSSCQGTASTTQSATLGECNLVFPTGRRLLHSGIGRGLQGSTTAIMFTALNGSTLGNGNDGAAAPSASLSTLAAIAVLAVVAAMNTM